MTKRVSIEEYEAMKAKAAKSSKYRAKKVELDGFAFDSKAEAKRYAELILMRKAGEISNLVVHAGYDLGSCYYKADFSYLQTGELWELEPVTEDVKGFMTRDCKIKLRLMKEKYGIDVRLLTKETDPRLFR